MIIGFICAICLCICSIVVGAVVVKDYVVSVDDKKTLDEVKRCRVKKSDGPGAEVKWYYPGSDPDDMPHNPDGTIAYPPGWKALIDKTKNCFTVATILDIKANKSTEEILSKL